MGKRLKRWRFRAIDGILSMVLSCLSKVSRLFRLRESETLKKVIKYFLKQRINNILLNYER